jgi:SAM-dependent MidA family methyltransferase
MAVDSEIRDVIKRQGYITVDEMIKLSMHFYAGSYYQKKSLLGEGGDFTTSPEISQLFGEIIGLWAIQQWYDIGSPRKFSLVELGPGRGFLMRDLMRVAKLDPAFYDAIDSIYFIEINPYFKDWQKRNLSGFNKKLKWRNRAELIPPLPSIFVANEFFDVLPIKQYLKVKELWYETILVIDPADSKIKFDKIPLSRLLQEQLLTEYREAHDGAVLEESLDSLKVVRFIGEHTNECGGAGVIIDYGYYIPNYARGREAFNSTLQAVRNHKYHPLLDNLGEADLSAQVDFFALERALKSRKVIASAITTQREFLLKYGIDIRAKLLSSHLPEDEKSLINKQLHRLIDNNQMGNLFKVMTFFNKTC